MLKLNEAILAEAVAAEQVGCNQHLSVVGCRL